MRSQFVWSRSTDLRTISRASSAASPVARLAAATTNAISRKLVGQIVDEIVHRDAVGQRRPLLVVAGIVGPFPGVAQVHVVADGHHHAALVVVYGAPAGVGARPFFSFFCVGLKDGGEGKGERCGG